MRAFSILFSGSSPTFKTFQTDFGTFPSATSPTDAISFTSSDGTVTITGNSVTKTIDFTSAGAGTVTTVSVVTANGVSGSVANPTTTPAITITLGAITPSSINASGSICGTSGCFSGTVNASAFNTGGTVTACAVCATTFSGSFFNGGGFSGCTVTLGSSLCVGTSGSFGTDVTAAHFSALATSIVSAGTNTTLCSGSACFGQNEVLTGTLNQTYTLPNATSLFKGYGYDFWNDSSGVMTIKDNGANTLFTVPSGGRVSCILITNGTSNGVWDFKVLAPSNASWGTTSLGVTGLITATSSVQGTKFIATGGLSTFVPALGGAIQINAPAAFAGPVFEIKSNGSQVSYISDLGNALFQNVNASGVSTNTISDNGAGCISVSSRLQPNSDGSCSLGNPSFRWDSIYGLNGYLTCSVNTCTVNTCTVNASAEVRLPTQGSSAITWQGNSHVTKWVLGNDAGSDQTWTWPGSVPGSTSVFQIDNAGNITYISAPTTPALCTVLGAGSDANNQPITNISYICGNGGTLNLGASTGDRVNFVAGAGASAPGLSTFPIAICVYGSSDGNLLGDPTEWLDVIINGNARKIALY